MMSYFNKWTVSFLIIGIIIYSFAPGLVDLINHYSTYSLRKQLVFLTGTLAFSMMTLTIIVAARFSCINKLMGGLDKAYLTHRSAGILCLIFTMLHWLIKKAPHWLQDFFVIARPANIGKGSLSSFEVLLVKSGNTIADYTFYVVIALVLIALIYKISYNLFRLTHKLFPLIYLLIAYHAVTIQLRDSWLKTPSGLLLSLLAFIGTICALIALLQLIGYKNKVTGIIKRTNIVNTHIISLELSLVKPFSFQNGQFVFLKFAHSSEPHPFSIISADTSSCLIQFAIKPLGDFTNQLHELLKPNQKVIVEGPYGELTFKSSAKKQLYIATGIGITPFIAHINSLAQQHNNKQSIDFWFCARGELGQQFPSSLAELCQRAKIKLHYINSLKNNDLLNQLTDYISANNDDINIWFCGSPNLLKAIQKILKDKNISLKKLNYDNFKMR